MKKLSSRNYELGEIMRPIASYVMPVKNGGKFIKKTLESLFLQTLNEIEIIVVNDHSEDDTVNIVNNLIKKDSRLRMIHLKDTTGVSAGRNAGTRVASGEIILPADADDLNFPNRAEVTIEELKRNKADLFYGNVERFYVETGERKPRHFQPYDAKLLRYINFIPNPASGFTRKVFDKVGPYDENLVIGEDYDLFLSAEEEGFKFCSKNVLLAQYTMQPNQVTSTNSPEKIRVRQKYNRLVRQKHSLFSIDIDYVKNKAASEVVDFYVNQKFDIWFALESIPER